MPPKGELHMTQTHQAAQEANQEWDQIAQESTSADRDPFPFGQDPWWGKVLILVIVFLPLLALGFAVWRLWGHGVGPLELGLLFGGWLFTGLGVSVGFHRMLTHRAFVAKTPTKIGLLMAATMALEGPPAGWAATHLRHHAKADHPGDPHSPLEGFWHAHMGWMLKDRMVYGGLAYDKLMQDKVVAFFTRTWVFWTVLSLTLPAIIGYLVYGTLMGAFDCFIWGSLIRVGLMHHTTWSVNSIGHMSGARPFKTNDRGANNPIVAIFGWGEGWHNNHHAFPRAAYIGMKWWQIDTGGWLVRFLTWIRQISHVYQPNKAEKRARMAR